MSNSPAPKKSLGQHWLDDQASLEAMVQAANIQPTDVVLEIGPGPGALTELLIKNAKHVVAVELDESLSARLTQKFPNIEVVSQDILRFDFTSLPADYRIAANIPYYLTSNLIRVISETPNQPMTAALLVQKEVAQRVTAQPGSMSILSVTAQFFWETSLGREVPARLFTPPPKVDSQILILTRRPKPLFLDVNSKDFFRLVKAGFAQKRKTLLNNLSVGLHMDKQAVKTIAGSVGIDPGRRAQTLSLEEWHNLYLSFNT